MNYGDLFWVNFPTRGGREQSGRRPAVVWQDTSLFQLPTLLLIPLTTQLSSLRFAGTALIQPSPLNGLAAPSAALVFQLGACDVRRIEGRIGRLDDADVATLQGIARQLQHLP